MSIGVNTLTNCVNAVLTADEQLSTLALLQVASVSKDFDEGFVYSVANVASLPAAADNTGRLVFVENQQKYFISDGVAWTDDLRSASIPTFVWGLNSCGQLGDGTTTNRLSPVSVVGGFTDWCQVSAGGFHTAAVRTNGTLWAWGRNNVGQLGDGTLTSSRLSPVSVVGGFTNWCQVSAGCFHTAAVRQNGTLWAWGYNSYGRLGDGTTTSKRSPVSVVGGFTDWCQVAASDFHTAAVRQNGTLWAWGRNNYGQLGDGTLTSSRLSPVSVVGGFTNWCQVSAGFNHTAAVRTNGTLWAWGSNGNGRLGNGTTTNRSSPVSVVGGFTDWCQVSAGCGFTAAVRQNGTLWAWGCNGAGRLGDDTTTDRSSPVSVVGGFTDWCQVSAGCGFTAAVRQNGTLWAWGRNFSGQLGDDTTTDRSSPVSVIGGFADWCQVAAGDFHTAAVRLIDRF